MEMQRGRIVKTVLKKVKIMGFILLDFSTYHTVMKKVGHWFKCRHIRSMEQNTEPRNRPTHI